MWDIVIKLVLGLIKKGVKNSTIKTLTKGLNFKKRFNAKQIIMNSIKPNTGGIKSNIVNPILAATREYNYQKQLQWKKLFSEYRKIYSQVEQEMIRKFKMGKGFSTRDFRDFRDYFLSKNFKDKSTLRELFKNEIEITFDSTWIYFGIFIPYGRQQKSGILMLQLYEGSRKNPSGLYQWIRVPRKVWDKLNDKPTGKQFWKVWYSKNYKNKKYLTIQSRYWYYNNNSRKKSKKKKR